RSSRRPWGTPIHACWSGSTASSLQKSSVDAYSCTCARPFRTASLMHQLGPNQLEFPDRLDELESPTPRNWCPGAESNHRHGDFQSLDSSTQYLGTTGISTLGMAALPSGCQFGAALEISGSHAPRSPQAVQGRARVPRPLLDS